MSGDRGHKWWRRVGATLFWLLISVGAVLLGISIWVRRTFGEISIDQMLSNLPGGGAEGGGTGLVFGGVLTGILIPLLIVAVIAVLTVWIPRRRRAVRIADGHPPVRRSTAIRRTRVVGAAVLAVAVPVGGGAVLSHTIGADDYVRAVAREVATGETLSDYYVAPRPGSGISTVADTGSLSSDDEAGSGTADEKPNNLVLIYLESIEEKLSDDSIMERDMLEPLEQSTSDPGWTTIPSLDQYEGGGWTMSGIVSSQCGVPLRTAGVLPEDADMNAAANEIGAEGHEVSSYLPGATCLGDVLEEKGYNSVYLGGASADFAGKGTFLSTHGYSEILDRSVWEAAGETEMRPDWGLSDRRLFEHAKEQVDRLHAEDQPFNLTMLSLDTHETPVLYDEYCEQTSEELMTSVTECSMRQVASFVDYLDEQGYLEDTTVVITGDHLKMLGDDLSFKSQLESRDDRTIFNRIWIPGNPSPEFGREEIDQLSLYPTILEAVGVEVADHRAGIGVSAFADPDDVGEGSILDLSSQDYSGLVASRSTAFYRDLWGDASTESRQRGHLDAAVDDETTR